VYYHAACMFNALRRARAGTKKIEFASDLDGFDNLDAKSKAEVKALIDEAVADGYAKTKKGAAGPAGSGGDDDGAAKGKGKAKEAGDYKKFPCYCPNSLWTLVLHILEPLPSSFLLPQPQPSPARCSLLRLIPVVLLLLLQDTQVAE